jgi:hypothetical protein
MSGPDHFARAEQRIRDQDERIAGLLRERAEQAQRIEELERERAVVEKTLTSVPEGHNQPCYYCGGRCCSLAASPGEWPVPLCHEDDPGVVKWHHTGCVSARLRRIAELEAEVERWRHSSHAWQLRDMRQDENARLRAAQHKEQRE